LKRFTNSNMKIRRRVNVDVKETNMSHWISFPHVLKNISPLYSTFAIVEHHGGSRGGHYISYTKHNDTWLNYDDTSNRVVKDESDLVNNDSYIFFMNRTPYLTPLPIVKDTNRE
jgi:ubiquitin C-terminal hydrolase